MKPGQQEIVLGVRRTWERDTVPIWLRVMAQNVLGGVWKEWVVRKGADFDRQREGMRVLRDAGDIICDDKEVAWGVAMSDDVAWLGW